MPEFRTTDIGQVMQTAEALKGMKREAENDRVRNLYMGEQMQTMQQNRQLNSAQEDRAKAAQQVESDQREAKRHYLLADNIERAPDPLGFVQQFAPEFIQNYEAKHGAGSFAQLPPEQIKREASGMKSYFASQAGIALNGTPEQQFAAGQAEKTADTHFSQQKELAAIQHKYSLEEIGAKGKVDAEKANTTNDHKTFRDTQALRKEFEGMQAVKDYRLVLPLYERAKTAPNTRAGDISVVYALGKMFDPGSVVREGEITLSQNAAPWVRAIVSKANSQLTGEGAIDKETRADIMQALQGQVSALAAPYDQERQRYEGYAKDNGWDPSSVVGTNVPSDAFGGQQGAPKPMSPEEAAKLPSGTQFIGLDGVPRVKH